MCVCLCGVSERQHRARARPRGPGRAGGLARASACGLLCVGSLWGRCPERTQNDRDSMYVCERVFILTCPCTTQVPSTTKTAVGIFSRQPRASLGAVPDISVATCVPRALYV